jgi:hypothetical protein
LKTDKAGEKSWETYYGGWTYDQASNVIQDKEGNFLLAGNSLPGGSNSNIYVVKSRGGPGLNSHLNWGGQSTDNGGSGGNNNSGNDTTDHGGSSGGCIIDSIIQWIHNIFHI